MTKYCRRRNFTKFVEFFSAMSDQTRQKILLLLEDQERCVTDLVKKFKLSQPTISRHLKILEKAGLVASRREKQKVYYRLNHRYLQHRFHHSLGCFCSLKNSSKKGGEKI